MYVNLTLKVWRVAEIRLPHHLETKSYVRVKTGGPGAPVDVASKALGVAEVLSLQRY